MGRRLVHIALLLAGFVPAVWGICIFGSDPRRAAVLIALAILGLALNGTVLTRPGFGLRIPLRVIAAGVALIVLAGVMAMWQWIRGELLPATPPAAGARHEILRTQSANLLWIAAAVAYVFVTVLIFPIPAEKGGPQTGRSDGIDFRTFGR
ncbi:MAG: hypothetical protein KKI02_00020 [Planctomycetes bacterium]|nr:hypothetical protein [Planctomycetota bacterium]